MESAEFGTKMCLKSLPFRIIKNLGLEFDLFMAGCILFN